MAFCNNCGAQLPDDGKFCTTCGAKVEEAAAAPTAAKQAAPAQAPVQKEKKPVNKKLFIILGAAVLALIVIVAVIVVVVNIVKTNQAIKDKTLVLTEKFFDVEVSGYDTLGTISIEVNDKFEDAAFDALGYTSKKDRKKEKAQEKYIDLKYTINYELSKDSELVNGDEITIKVVVDDEDSDLDIVLDNAKKKDKKEADIIIKETEFKYTVEDLAEVVKYNPFDDITIDMYGADGDVSVYWSYDGEYSYIWGSDFDCDNDYDLSIGDDFTLTLDEDVVDYMLDNNGVLITETSKTYTVESADRYIDKIDDVSDDLLTEMKDMAINDIDDEYYWSDATISDLEYLGMYLLNLKEGEYGDENIAILVYKGTVTPDDDDYDPFTAYVGCECYDLYESADGEQSVSSWSYFYGDSQYIAEDTWDNFYGYFTLAEMYDDVVYDYEDEYAIEVPDELSDYEEEVVEEEEVVAGEYETMEDFFLSDEGVTFVEAQVESLMETYGDYYESIGFTATENTVVYEYTYITAVEEGALDEEFDVDDFESDFAAWTEATGIEEITINVIFYNPDGTVVYDGTFSNF